MYLGIDLSGAAKRASGYAALSPACRLLDVGLVHSDEEVLALAARLGPRYVAIDAPLGLPEGLCCLDPSCGCRPTASDGIRACERELRRRGLGLFYTTKRTIIRGLVLRAIALRCRLEAGGLAVLEVFPYASKVLLFGRPTPKKTRPEGLAFLRGRLEGLVTGLAGQRPMNHDELDALVAAHTAYLFDRGLAEEVGCPAEGAICIPLAAARR